MVLDRRMVPLHSASKDDVRKAAITCTSVPDPEQFIFYLLFFVVFFGLKGKKNTTKPKVQWGFQCSDYLPIR